MFCEKKNLIVLLDENTFQREQFWLLHRKYQQNNKHSIKALKYSKGL